MWPPITMATQHPDNASVPWWRQDSFIPTQDEIDELLLLFKELPIDEYMWDWEGKYVDESVGEKLYARARQFFEDRPLGKDVHLTYRIPAFEQGKMHRMARAFMNVLSLADLAAEIGLEHPPVTEMFLPLTTSAQQPLEVRRTFREIAGYHRNIFHHVPGKEQHLPALLEVTPLIEDIGSLFGIRAIAGRYWEELRREKPEIATRGQRVFLARSDPALNSGLVPAVLAVKAALSTLAELSEEHDMPVYPIIGTGSLPFRGNVNPQTVAAFLDQYAGTRTYSIQSAFRYDYPKEQVQTALEEIKTGSTRRTAQRFTVEEVSALHELAIMFEGFWKPTIEALAALINVVAPYVPQRRERLQHIGLFGYSRGVGSVKLPRAIGFTAALYSLGTPPELIATGRGLRQAEQEGKRDLLERAYPLLQRDLLQAGRYFNRENLELMRSHDSAFDAIAEDITGIEAFLGQPLGPQTSSDIIHRNITSTVFHRLQQEPNAKAMRRDIVEAGILRCSLG